MTTLQSSTSGLQVCRAHRNFIKPLSLLLFQQDQPRSSCWGISKVLTKVRSQIEILNSPCYSLLALIVCFLSKFARIIRWDRISTCVRWFWTRQWSAEPATLGIINLVACSRFTQWPVKRWRVMKLGKMRSLFYNGHRLGSLGSGRTGECVNNRAGRFVHRCGLVRPAVETKQINTSLSLPIILPIFGWLRS